MLIAKPELWLPHADIREYIQYWFTDIPEGCDKGFVGCVENTTNKDIRIRIEIDDRWMTERNQRHCALYIGNDYIKDCIIVVTKDFFDSMRNDESVGAFLWHEVGHYHTNHYFPEYIGESYSKLRKHYIEMGKVYPAEYAADLMAVYYYGWEKTNEALLMATRKRHAMINDGDNNANLAWWELRTRRRLLSNMKTDQDIESALCSVFGASKVDDI